MKKKHQYKEFSDRFRKYLPGDTFVFDPLYLMRLAIFFHTMSFIRYLFCSLTMRNMSSSFTSLLSKLNRKSNYRDILLCFIFFFISLLTLFLHQILSYTWGFTKIFLRELLPRLRFLPKAFLSNIRFMNEDTEAPQTKDDYPSAVEILMIVVALFTFGIIDAF